MKIIALDLATTSGWALADGSGAPSYGSQRMGPRGGSLGECYVFFRDWFSGQLDEHCPAVVIFEAPLLVNRGSVEVVQRLMGLAAHADEIGTRRGLRVYRAEGSTVTKAFTGRAVYKGGRAAKKEAVMMTCRRYGWEPKNDNEGDALALLHFAQSILGAGRVGRAAGPLFSGSTWNDLREA